MRIKGHDLYRRQIRILKERQLVLKLMQFEEKESQIFIFIFIFKWSQLSPSDCHLACVIKYVHQHMNDWPGVDQHLGLGHPNFLQFFQLQVAINA